MAPRGKSAARRPARPPVERSHAASSEPVAALRRRVRDIDWEGVAASLDACGHARLPDLLGAPACRELARGYRDDASFRKTIDMRAHRFGDGEYRYFDRPLPSRVAALREALYPPLARIANGWQARLGSSERFEPSLRGFLRRCAAAGQRRPTPLLLHYREGGFNCLHQDLYGEVAFPLQVAIGLSSPERDFRGGEFLLVEQRPRQQSRGEVIALAQGEAVVFPTRERPVAGARGWLRAQVRHGVSRLRGGERFTLGIIFHDAR